MRVPLDTEFETVAAVKALELLHSPPLEAADEFAREVDKYIEDMRTHDLLSETFVGTRKLTLMAFARDCELRRVTDITSKEVERWMGILKNGEGKGKRVRPVKKGTIESYVFSLRAFCGWLVEKKKIRENPVTKIKLGKVSRVVRKNFVPAESVRTLIAKAPNDEMRFILYCGFHAGMRKREIVEMRPHWIRFGFGDRRGRISVEQTPTFRPKDRDERSIPLSREFEEFLKEYMKRVPDGAEFLLKPDKKHGKHKYRYDFRKPFEALLKACGVKCLVHDMRRTFVSLKLIEDSPLIFKLAKWTGDDVRVIQDHYGHLLSDDEDIEVGIRSVGTIL